MKHIKQSHQLIIGALLLAVVAFYAGGKYASAKTTVAPQTRGQFTMGGQAGAARGGIRGGAGATAGEIIGKDSQSITVKLQSGGSRIVFLSASTTVQKTVPGTVADLTVGAGVLVTGAANSDGSVTASSVDLRALPKVNN